MVNYQTTNSSIYLKNPRRFYPKYIKYLEGKRSKSNSPWVAVYLLFTSDRRQINACHPKFLLSGQSRQPQVDSMANKFIVNYRLFGRKTKSHFRYFWLQDVVPVTSWLPLHIPLTRRKQNGGSSSPSNFCRLEYRFSFELTKLCFILVPNAFFIFMLLIQSVCLYRWSLYLCRCRVSVTLMGKWWEFCSASYIERNGLWADSCQ